MVDQRKEEEEEKEGEERLEKRYTAQSHPPNDLLPPPRHAQDLTCQQSVIDSRKAHSTLSLPTELFVVKRRILRKWVIISRCLPTWYAHQDLPDKFIPVVTQNRSLNKTKQKKNMETGPVEDRVTGWKGTRGGRIMHCIMCKFVKEEIFNDLYYFLQLQFSFSPPTPSPPPPS